jgi:hypothetical protein
LAMKTSWSFLTLIHRHLLEKKRSAAEPLLSVQPVPPLQGKNCTTPPRRGVMWLF